MKIQKTLDISIQSTGPGSNRLREQTVLNNKVVTGIVSVCFRDSGTLTAAQLQGAQIRLRDKNNKVIIDGLPLFVFDPKLNANGTIQEVEFDQEIDWNQSEIILPAGVSSGQLIPLHVIYKDKK
jgi:hypothetical protein